VRNQSPDCRRPLWTPANERLRETGMAHFLQACAAAGKITEATWAALYQWSIRDLDDFWHTASEYLNLKFKRNAKRAWSPGPSMRSSKWFDGSLLNFAENLMPTADSREVLVAFAEGCPRASWTGLQLWNDVARCAAALRKAGATPGDCIAGVLSNGPEAVIAMLATAAVGGIWSSCSPDFGARGVADRFIQVDPKIVFVTKAYQYGGKFVDCELMIKEALASIASAPIIVQVDHFNRSRDEFEQFLKTSELDGSSTTPLPIEFVGRCFNDPLYILFSSGTTGLPKCITHGVGGTLLQHKKELVLHSDVKPGDRLFYFTTCGWMMWNWMVSALSCGASIVTFDGNPAFPSTERLWNICRDEYVTHFGTSPKFLSTCMQSQVTPEQRRLRVILSTGSPLLHAHYQWVYDRFPDIHLASISGGTDIISCFMLGNPLLPVYSGEIQSPGLGMAIEAWDDQGIPVIDQKAELVCTKPFVSMPVCFWNDEGGERYRKAYFSYFTSRDVWRHGDFVEMTSRGGIIVYGRSDATLNPGGVRIGTAEIYRVVETLPFVMDSVAISQAYGDDTRVVLFVKPSPQVTWNQDYADQIKSRIRSELSPRHVPAVICPVGDIPYTRSGKKVEMAVTQVVNGQSVLNKEALANPESLVEYQAWGQSHGGRSK
jgi:acetoacetyl-CoA synthetase